MKRFYLWNIPAPRRTEERLSLKVVLRNRQTHSLTGTVKVIVAKWGRLRKIPHFFYRIELEGSGRKKH